MLALKFTIRYKLFSYLCWKTYWHFYAMPCQKNVFCACVTCMKLEIDLFIRQFRVNPSNVLIPAIWKLFYFKKFMHTEFFMILQHFNLELCIENSNWLCMTLQQKNIFTIGNNFCLARTLARKKKNISNLQLCRDRSIKILIATADLDRRLKRKRRKELSGGE